MVSFIRHDGKSGGHDQLLDQRDLAHRERGRVLQPQPCLLCQGGCWPYRDQGGNFKKLKLKKRKTNKQWNKQMYVKKQTNLCKETNKLMKTNEQTQNHTEQLWKISNATNKQVFKCNKQTKSHIIVWLYITLQGECDVCIFTLEKKAKCK